jgi:glutamate/tyrosine decarboxylase-like PLP-dependent enzyme
MIKNPFKGSKLKDTDPSFNFSTYSTYWMPEDLHKEHVKYLGYNSINKNEYPRITQKELELSKYFASRLFSDESNAYGCSTTGSTESSLLAALSALKHSIDRGVTKPNIVMNQNIHHS